MNTKTLGIIGAAAMGVGAFLPWASITAAFVGTISKSGIDGGDGWGFVVFAVLVAVGAVNGLPWMPAIFGGLGLALGIYEAVDINNRIGDVADLATASIGLGLWLCIAGSVAAIVAGVLAANAAVASAQAALAATDEGTGTDAA